MIAALAAFLGWLGPKSWKAGIGYCVLISALGWAASYLIAAFSTSVDAAYAEDWINGFSVSRAVPEIAVALAWTFLWFGSMRAAWLLTRDGRKQTRSLDWLKLGLVLALSVAAILSIVLLLNVPGDCAPRIADCGDAGRGASFVLLGVGGAWLIYIVIRFVRSPNQL